MPIGKCPNCGKVISLRFPIHECEPLTKTEFEAPLTKATQPLLKPEQSPDQEKEQEGEKREQCPLLNSTLIASAVIKVSKEQELMLTPLELSELEGNEWLSGRWYYDPYKIMEAQLAKIKKAGYVSPEEMDILSIKGTIQSFLLANHYVQLAEDQSCDLSSLVNSGSSIPLHFRTFDLMLKAGWRRVEVKDGN